MLIDAFTFNSELPILEIRLNELNDIVDYFILVENSQTQCGNPKPYFFEENKYLFTKFLSKIIHVKLDTQEEIRGFDWSLENFQRKSIINGIQQLQDKGVKLDFDNDYILISDIDEIPKKEIVKECLQNKEEMISFDCKFLSYYLDLECPHRNWYGSVLTKLESLTTLNCQQIRNFKDHVKHTAPNSGWHFSYINHLGGGFEAFWDKIFKTIEPKDKSFLIGKKEFFQKVFQDHVCKDKYFLFVDDLNNKSIKLEKMNSAELPEFVRENMGSFNYLLMH